MEPFTTGIVCIILMLIMLLGLDVPVGFALGLSGAIGLYFMGGSAALATMVSHLPYLASASYTFLAFPMFILMGFFVAETGLSTDLFVAAHKWLGWIRGGLAMAVSAASAAMGAVIGSGVTVSITMTSIALPEMRKYGYKDILSLGMIAGAGGLGALIPPSVPFILYGVLTETSIGHLFIAGIGPGIMCMVLFCVGAYIFCLIDPKAGPAIPRVPLREAIRFPSGVYIVILLAIVCLGGIYAGFATPTEAGGLGAFITLIFGLATRRLDRSRLLRGLDAAIRTTGMLFIMIIGAKIFSSMLAISGVPFKMVEALMGLAVSPWVVLFMIIVIYIMLGFFLDMLAVLLVLLPVLAPLFKAFGFDPVWIGVLTVMTILIGGITPPFGILIFALAGFVRDVPMTTIFKGALPYTFMMIVATIIMLFFPDIALALVKTMKPWAYD